MQKVYKILVLVFISSWVCSFTYSQEKSSDTTITSIDADLINIFNQKTSKKYKVAGIKVTGNRYFDENLLVSISGLSVGDEISIPGGDNFSKAISKLWSQNYFSNVEIYITKLEGKNITLEIVVTERPRLSQYEIRGIKKGDADDLKGKTGLIPGRVVTENMKRTATEAITKFYAEKGFQNAKIRIDERKDTSISNSVSLVFNVSKGVKVKINNVSFVGNTIPDNKLKKQLKGTKEKTRLSLYASDDKGGFITPQPYTFEQYLKEKGFLTLTQTKKVLSPYVRLNLFSSAKFSDKKYIEDKEKIIDYYNANGYRDAVIEKDTIVHNNVGALNIDIKVNEGHKYYFGDIKWKGNTKYPDSILSQILSIHKGDVYNLDALNKKLGKNGASETADVSALYMDDGYLFFRTDPVETAVYNDTIDYEIRIVEGPQATIKNVRISGNEKTKEYVIRREIRTVPGDKFSRTDLIRSQREIAQLNFFNQEKIGIDPVPNPEDGTVDINYKVEEKSSDQLELSAGWGGVIGLTGTLGISFNNFSIRNILHKSAWDPLPMGDGQKLSLRVQSNGKAFRSYNFSFTEPWLGGKKRNPFSVSVYDTKFANAYNPSTGTYTSSAANNSYLKTTGISLSLGKQLKWPDDYFSASVGVSFVRYTLKNYYISPVTLPGFNNGYSHNFSVKFAIQRSSIDNPMFARRGSNFMASLQLTPPYSLLDPNVVNKSNPYEWIEYHKWRFNGDWYLPLTAPTGADHKQLVFRASAKFGFLGRYNPKLQISPFERFQVGDAGLSNQYAIIGYDIISHRGYPVYQTSDPKYNPDQSGASEYFTMFNKYTLELRYPLSLNPSSTIYALGFFEAANGWYDIKEYNPFKLRRSVGVGMRFFLPMFGLLGFDYGIGLDRYTPGGGLKAMSKFTFMLGYEPE
jgi:outer membrane protein insertion porin family